MTIDEEIRLAKQEKELNKKVNGLMESLEIGDDEGALLTLKYCETAEMLREFDYKSAIFKTLKESRDYRMMNELNETVNSAKEKIYSTDIKVVTEGYRDLARLYINLKEGKYYHTCPNCGANLDPGEKCDCQNEKKKLEERFQRTNN